MYHVLRWHSDRRFFSPMAFGRNDFQIFIRDCVGLLHPTLNTMVTALVVKLWYVLSEVKTFFYLICYIIHTYT